MTVVVRENVVVNETDTEIIEPLETNKNVNRIFAVSNGDNKIEIIAWGSNDGANWINKGTKEIDAHNNDSLIVGPNVYWVKLTGKTISPGTTSTVDACLTY